MCHKAKGQFWGAPWLFITLLFSYLFTGSLRLGPGFVTHTGLELLGSNYPPALVLALITGTALNFILIFF
jgi:hypothetical protein